MATRRDQYLPGAKFSPVRVPCPPKISFQGVGTRSPRSPSICCLGSDVAHYPAGRNGCRCLRFWPPVRLFLAASLLRFSDGRPGGVGDCHIAVTGNEDGAAERAP